MTDNYKEMVLKYITGNLPQQVGENEPEFKDVSSTTNNLYTQIKSYFSSRVAYVDFIPSKNNKNQNLEYSVLACRGTLNGEADESGAFVILDKEYNIVDIITHYSDGSLIGVLYCLNVDDEGNYYAVELNGSTYRIVALNNLVLKPASSNTYKAIKIDTHNIPNTYTWEGMLKVFRNVGANKYFVVGNRENGAGIVGCELTIENTDTWNYYTSTIQKQFTLAMFDNGYNVYWDSTGELHFQIGVSNEGLVILSKGTGTTMNSTRYTFNEGVSNSQNTLIFLSNKVGYYAESTFVSGTSTSYTIYKIDLENNLSKVVYTDTGLYTIYNWLFFFKNNNGIYFFQTLRTADDEHEFNLKFGFINNEEIYTQALGTFTANIFTNAFCYPNVITDFNKNYIYIQNQNTLFSLNFIWNTTNYNGNEFISNNSLIPNVITIEDENETEIFNRNLYNLSTYSNWYTASVQIPNYFLNNTQLDTALLYSKNNNLLTSSYINAEKNIYEALNINFTNKFKIIDKGTENISGASEFVNSMLIPSNTATLNKIRINYHDNTNEIKNISTNDLTYSDLKTTYKIMVFVNKLIDTIDLISEDENITYSTINGSNLELNKYYLINQDIKIE